MKKFTFILLNSIFALGFFLIANTQVYAFSGSGSGISADPFIITTCSQLQEMKDNLSADYKLGNDIDCSATSTWNSGAGFEQVGTFSNEFSGDFDGNHYSISQLTINRPSTVRIGMFGKTNGSTISDVVLSDFDITGDYNVGALMGDAAATTIENVFIKGGQITIRGTSIVGGGGVAGNINSTSTLLNVYSTADVSGTGIGIDAEVSVGGLVGYNGGSIKNSYASGDVTATSDEFAYAGGLVGYNIGLASAKIINAFAVGTVTSNDKAGGLVGYCYGGSITNSYSVDSSLCGSSSTTTIDGSSTGGVTLASFYQTSPLHAVYTGTPAWGFDNAWDFKDTSSLPVFPWISTPTPTPTSSPQSSSSGGGSVSAPSCGDAAPSGVPDLFQIDTNSSQAKLYFGPVSNNTDRYFISYGYTSGDMRFGTQINGNSTGVMSTTLNYLTPNTIYYVRVRAGNGCATGGWSNEMKITTGQSGSTSGNRYYESFAMQIITFISHIVSF